MKVAPYILSLLLGVLNVNNIQAQKSTVTHPQCVHDRPQLPYEQRLYFKPTSSESCWGDIVSNGKVIYHNVYFYLSNCDIPELELNAPFTVITQNRDTTTSPNNLFYYNIHTIDANGKFMYHPYFYDNYADYWVQGTRRIVANNKMGVVNIFNEIIIPPKDYNFITIAMNGYFKAYKNVKSLRFTDEDGQVPITDGTPIIDYYNLKGEQITTPQWDSLYQEGVATTNVTWGYPLKDQQEIDRIAQQLIALPQVEKYITEFLKDDLINYRFILYQKKQHYYFGLQQTWYQHLNDLLVIECNNDLSFLSVLDNDMQQCISIDWWAVKYKLN